MQKIFETSKLRKGCCWLAIFAALLVIANVCQYMDRLNLQISNERLQTENVTLKITNEDYRKYLLEEKLLIELKAENTDNSNTLPTVTLVEENMLESQPMCSDSVEAGMMCGNALFYYPDAKKVRLHFKMNPPRECINLLEGRWKTFKNWTLTCKDPDNKNVKVEKDKTNPNYYYINLEKKGSYLFKKTYGKCKLYFWVTW